MSSLARFLCAHDPVVRVAVVETSGSTPRDAGAEMYVAATAIFGTIGGGQLEHLAIERARARLGGPMGETLDVPLGPEIGQCCGGRATLSLTPMTADLCAAVLAEAAERAALLPTALIFGAGHVGRALAVALSPLPLRAVLIDQREAELKEAPPGAETRLSALPEAEVEAARPGAAFVTLTHDHALDFLIAEAALARGDAAYVGMIGSATKRATFENALRREGRDAPHSLICPIGVAGLGDKRPAVIAAHAAAEIAAALFAVKP